MSNGAITRTTIVIVDDKLRILTAFKEIWDRQVTTIFVRQGHYASDEKAISGYPAADYTIDRIGDLMKLDLNELSPTHARRA